MGTILEYAHIGLTALVLVAELKNGRVVKHFGLKRHRRDEECQEPHNGRKRTSKVVVVVGMDGRPRVEVDRSGR